MSKFKELLGNQWYEELNGFIHHGHLANIARKVNVERMTKPVVPEKGSGLMFKAFRETPYNKVKVIILGQDPYHTIINKRPVFDGLAFSNSTSLRPQPSLENILDEVERDIYDGMKLDRVAKLSLYSWAHQGVLLVNTSHSVVKGQPGSHLEFWKPFTLKVIEALNEKNDLVWLLWGAKSIVFKQYVTNPSHAVICTSHPSPLSANKKVQEYPAFNGSRCFSQVNEALEARNQSKIVW
jgi:uracil-DNA glycosylase